jgi:hypothetical protein
MGGDFEKIIFIFYIYLNHYKNTKCEFLMSNIFYSLFILFIVSIWSFLLVLLKMFYIFSLI